MLCQPQVTEQVLYPTEPLLSLFLCLENGTKLLTISPIVPELFLCKYRQHLSSCSFSANMLLILHSLCRQGVALTQTLSIISLFKHGLKKWPNDTSAETFSSLYIQCSILSESHYIGSAWISHATFFFDP